MRLVSKVGHINTITHADAAKMGDQLRRLTQTEERLGHLHTMPIQNVAYWAELIVHRHRLYIVAILTPESTVQQSSLSRQDLLLSGIELLPTEVDMAMGVSAVRFWDRREAKVRRGAGNPDDATASTYLQLPPDFTESRTFRDRPDAYTGQHPVSF